MFLKTLLLCGILFWVSMLSARQAAVSSVEPAWVGLYSNALIDWLENENRLDALCPASVGTSIEHHQCRAEKLQTRPFVVALGAGPSRTAESRGALLVLATPGRGLRFFYAPRGSGTPLEFEPDLNMQDWGYGPYFHQTYLDRRGDWFLLPQDPFPAGTWINARDFDDEPHTLAVEGIVNSPQGPLVVLGIDSDGIRARPEQPADMWCQGDEPPALEPWQELRIPKASLYSPAGHLLLSPRYMKGC